MVTFRQSLAQSFHHTFDRYDGANFQQSSQYNHVESLGHFSFVGFVHGINAIHMDVLACRRVDDAVSVVNQYSTRLYLALKLGKRRLVQDDGCVILAENRG